MAKHRDSQHRRQIAKRLAALRQLMAQHRCDYYLIPTSDPHQNEYVPPCWQRRAWISGFSGSAGSVLVGHQMAGLWTDGRYHVQAELELGTGPISLFRQGLPDVPDLVSWIAQNMRAGETIAVDPAVISRRFMLRLKHVVGRAGGAIKLIATNFIDALWVDRPTLPSSTIESHPPRFSGESVAAKLNRVRRLLKDAGAIALIVTTLDDLAWLFNVRGSDIPFNPVVIAHAIIGQHKSYLFVRDGVLPPRVHRSIPASVTPYSYGEFHKALKALAHLNKPVAVDEAAVSVDVIHHLGRTPIRFLPQPIARMKAVKNGAEIRGARQAHLRDGVAMARFLCWLEHRLTTDPPTELEAAAHLRELRSEGTLFRGESFSAISAFGAHAAIVHYCPTPDSNVRLKGRGIFLIDSGGQYRDGTTDITRSILVGASAKARYRQSYTQVLRGHIDLARCRFPKGTSGRQLDAIARYSLWQSGNDYAHGTGHGVGSYLCVHEGPQAFSPRATADSALLPGHILSDEPGFYQSGEFGIRLENLLLVCPDEERSNGQEFCHFEVLTLCPFDRRLIDGRLLDHAHRQWLNHYHRRVQRCISPYLSRREQSWLADATRPI